MRKLVNTALLHLPFGKVFPSRGVKEGTSAVLSSCSHRWGKVKSLGYYRRDLWRSSTPTSLLKQGHLDPVVQEGLFSDYFWISSKDGDSTTSLGNLYQFLVTLTKCFLLL